MKSTAQVIGLFGVIQCVVIVSGWLVTRSFRKIYLATTDGLGIPEDLPAMSNFFANYGPFFLLIPLLWWITMAGLVEHDDPRHSDTAQVSRISIASTVIVLAACADLYA